MTVPCIEREASPLAEALAKVDRQKVAKTIDAGTWQSTSIEQVREVANDALKETGLAFHLSQNNVEIIEGSGLIRASVTGHLEYGPSGERRLVSADVLDKPSPRQALVQQCGALYSYAAKFAIVNTRNLPRGGDDSSEYAHKEVETTAAAPRPRKGR